MILKEGKIEKISAQDLLNILNSSIYDNSSCGRYDLVKNFRIPTFEVTVPKKDRPEDCVVNIILWGKWQFYKWAYLSFLSAITNTDILDFKIRIIIREDEESTPIYEVVKYLFSPLGADVEILPIKFKYSAVLEQDERYQIVLDADTLLINGNYPIFRNLYNLLKSEPGFYTSSPDDSWVSQQRINICHDGFKFSPDSKTIKDFWSREIEFGEKALDDVLEENSENWSWNIFYGLDKNIFDTQEWRDISSRSEEVNWWDDEGVFQLYLWKIGKKVGYMRDLFGIRVPTRNSFDPGGFNIRSKYPDIEAFAGPALDFIDGRDSGFTVLHPTNWSWMLGEEYMLAVFDKIILEATERGSFFDGPLLI